MGLMVGDPVGEGVSLGVLLAVVVLLADSVALVVPEPDPEPDPEPGSGDAAGDAVAVVVVTAATQRLLLHTPLRQSEFLEQMKLAAQAGHLPPPQSTSVSMPLRTLSEHWDRGVGVLEGAEVLEAAPPGLLVLLALPTTTFGVRLGDGDRLGVTADAAHRPPTQALVEQSPFTKHPWPILVHAGHATGGEPLKPPQSTSVSRPFFLPS